MNTTEALLGALGILTIAACSGTIDPGDSSGQGSLSSAKQPPGGDPVGGKTPSSPAVPCRSLTMGDGTTCLDFSTIKTRGAALCASNETLTSLQPGTACPGGALTAQIQCCVPSPEQHSCTGKVLGDGTSCLDPATVGTSAVALCAATGTHVTEMYFGRSPGCTLGTIAKILCCADAPTPPSKTPPPPSGK